MRSLSRIEGPYMWQKGKGIMKKRFICTCLTAAMVAGLCGCGAGAKEETTAAAKQTEAATQEVAAAESQAQEPYVPTYPIVDEKITITGLVVGEDTSVSSTRVVWDEVEKVTNIHIEWENIDNEAFATRLASGDWPDLIAHKIEQTGVNDYGVLGGKFVNYLDYLDIMPNLKKAFEDYPVTLACATQMNGEVYNLFRISGPTCTSVMARPHYRADVLAEAGITEAPATIDEFYNCLVTLKEYYGVPSYIHNKNMLTDYNPILFPAFGELTQMDFADDGTGKLVFARTTEQMKLYYKFLHKLYDEELMNREYLTLDNATALKLAQSGQVAFILQDSANKLTADDLKDGNFENLGTLKPFTSEYDDNMEIVGYLDYYDTHGMYINKESEYVEEICKMLDICFAEEEVVEGSNLYGVNFSQGPENVVWTANGDGTYTETCPDGFKNKSTYMNQVYIWDSVGRRDVLGSMTTSTVGNAWARQTGYVNNILPYQSDVIVRDSMLKFTDDEQYVVDNKYGEIKSYYEQMEAEFISGASDIDSKWDEYVATLEKMGAAEVLEVYQAAYDRFNTALNALSE